jgi:hypothetical protein
MTDLNHLITLMKSSPFNFLTDKSRIPRLFIPPVLCFGQTFSRPFSFFDCLLLTAFAFLFFLSLSFVFFPCSRKKQRSSGYMLVQQGELLIHIYMFFLYKLSNGFKHQEIQQQSHLPFQWVRPFFFVRAQQ